MKSLPEMEHSFTIDVTGSETKKKWSGNFTYRRPNLRMQSEIGRTEARLNAEVARTLDPDIKTMHNILATLRHTLTEFPKWWEEADYGYELYDFNVVSDIYKKCMAFEDEYFKKVWGENNPSDSSKSESQG